MSVPIGRLFWEGSEFDKETGGFTSNLLAIDRDNNQTKFSIKVRPETVNAIESRIKELCEAIRTRRWAKDNYLAKELRLLHHGGMCGASNIDYYYISLIANGVLAFGRFMHSEREPHGKYMKVTNVDLSDCDDGELERIAIRLRNALRDPRENDTESVDSILDAQGGLGASPEEVPPTEPLSFGDAAPSQVMPSLEW